MSIRNPHDTEQSVPSGEALRIEYTLRLSGELTQATVGRFEKAIRGALESSPREIVVDLTGIDSIDDTGLTSLLKAHLRSRQRGRPITFVPSDHEVVKQVVAVTGTDEITD